MNTLDDFNSNRITRILTTDFPQYFAIITRIRQEIHAIGPEGGILSSTVVPQVQAIFPEGALTKKIKVGLQVGHDDDDTEHDSHASKAANNKRRRILGSFGLGKALRRLFGGRRREQSGVVVAQNDQMVVVGATGEEKGTLKECCEEKGAALPLPVPLSSSPSSAALTTKQLNLVSSLTKSGDDKIAKSPSTADHVAEQISTATVANNIQLGNRRQSASVVEEKEEGGGEVARRESKFAMWVLINNSSSSENQANPSAAQVADDVVADNGGEVSVRSAGFTTETTVTTDSALGGTEIPSHPNNNTTTEYDCNDSLVSEAETCEEMTRSDSRRNNIFHIVNIRPSFSNGFVRQRKIDLDDSALETTYTETSGQTNAAAATSMISSDQEQLQEKQQSRSRASSNSTLNQFSMTSATDKVGKGCSKAETGKKKETKKLLLKKSKQSRKAAEMQCRQMTSSSSGSFSSNFSFVTVFFPRVTMLSKMV